MTTSNTPASSTIWALLVGIDRYLTQNELSGCVSDVLAMKSLLRERYNVPEGQIKVLKNEEATRANIIKAFQEFLINNPAIKRGDQILVHYSGHGSQMPAQPSDAEPDNLNETIVPHDSRTNGVYDIPDKTLAALLNTLAEAKSTAKGDNITVILDSCHSGSGTRAPDEQSPRRVRRIPADPRQPPADLDADLRQKAKTRSGTTSGWALPEGRHVLLAGCRDSEESNEYEGNLEEGTANWHGALTFFIIQTLRQLPPGISYDELHERVAPLVNAQFSSQTPQCEGDTDRQVFSGVRVYRDPFVSVRQVSPNGQTVTLAAGVVLGVVQDTELEIYGQEVRTKADIKGPPIATIKVVSAGPTSAEATVIHSSSQAIPGGARALITKPVLTGNRQSVILEADEGAENEQAIAGLRDTIAPGGRSATLLLQLIDDPAGRSTFRVKASEGKFKVHDDDGKLLLAPFDFRQATGGALDQDEVKRAAGKVLGALESIVRWRNIRSLNNDQGGENLRSKVKIRLRRYVEGPQGVKLEELPAHAISAEGKLTIYVDPQEEKNNRYVVDVFNGSDVEIYPNLFILNPDFSINRIYPNVAPEGNAVPPTAANQPFTAGLNQGSERLEFSLPAGWDASDDYLLCIITTKPANLSALQQNALTLPSRGTRGVKAPSSRLQKLLTEVSFGTRFGGTQSELADEEWTTLGLRINSVRAFEQTKLDAPETTINLSNGATLVKPKGLRGTLALTTWSQAARSRLAEPGLRPPPGLLGMGDRFQPVTGNAARGIDTEAGLMLTFEVEDDSYKAISPDNPLRLQLPAGRGTEGGEEIWPIAFDGEDFLLVGYSADGANSVNVVTLPAPVEGPTTRRGVGRTIRLFLYKKIGRHSDEIGLRRAKLVDGEVAYSAVQKADFKDGDRIALFVHGFNSDGAWMIKGLGRFLQEEVFQARPYDHLLTWDYETFGTGVADSGRDLALDLKAKCGLGPADKIALDVYAHSMGSLVSRCLIELSGGNEFVDRAVLAGPPNEGTTLATIGHGFVFLTSALINRVEFIPFVGGVSWVLKQIYEQSPGLGDLAVESAIVHQLNALQQPSNVPYLVLAGENVLNDNEHNRLDRLAKKLLDKGLDELFGEQNDVVIGITSLKSVRRGSYPLATVIDLSCNHFDYFNVEEGKAAIRGWLTA